MYTPVAPFATQQSTAAPSSAQQQQHRLHQFRLALALFASLKPAIPLKLQISLAPNSFLFSISFFLQHKPSNSLETATRVPRLIHTTFTFVLSILKSLEIILCLAPTEEPTITMSARYSVQIQQDTLPSSSASGSSSRATSGSSAARDLTPGVYREYGTPKYEAHVARVAGIKVVHGQTTGYDSFESPKYSGGYDRSRQ
ncbi:hypothetical protein S40288_10846 [Stachybotrys chartarum IBT 40288]|nr:hypothetical protein S40288_10846 [Stachybotrys chartarum IBT 40288]